MSGSVALGLVSSLLGGGLVALITYLSTRRKTAAETRKIIAEATSVEIQNERNQSEMEARKRAVRSAPTLPSGWNYFGINEDDYDITIDDTVAYSGRISGRIKGPPGARGFGSLIQTIRSDDYRGKRLQLSGFVKTDGVLRWAGLWMRVDDVSGESTLVLDNMNDRPITGTIDWRKYRVVLDVPYNSGYIAFGALLTGEGSVWVDDFELSVVDDSVPVTGDVMRTVPRRPLNMDFESE